MTEDEHRNRTPKGTPAGGQFSAQPHGEAPISLGAEPVASVQPVREPIPVGLDDVELAAELKTLPPRAAITTAAATELDEFVHHPDPYVRAGASVNLHLTEEQLAHLADPAQQPWIVRSSVARLLYPGVAGRAARDPDPLIRWQALGSGWDLPTHTREQLLADDEVRRVAEVLSRRHSVSTR